MRKTWAVLAVLLLAVGGSLSYYFYQKKPEVNVVGFPTLTYPSFQTWPTPRDFDGPGTLFVLKDGYLEYHSTLQVPVIEAGGESIGSQAFKSKWGGNVLARFLSAAKSSLDTKNDLDVEVALGGVRRTRVELDRVEASLREMAGKKYDGELYVIHEAISVTQIRYTVTSSTALSSETELTPAPGADAKVRAKKDNDGKWIIDATYTRPHYLFYRPKRVTLLHGMNRPQVVLEEAEAPLRWRAERRTAARD